MKKLNISALPLMLLLGACDRLIGKAYSFRYKMTVEVETPQGLKTGSSVVEDKLSRGSGIPDTALRFKRRGEATIVDLPNGRVLIVVFQTPAGFNASPAESAYEDVLPSPLGNEAWAERAKAMAKQRTPAVLPPSAYPMMITFRDVNDPTTVEAVGPKEFEHAFGSGVRLKRIIIQVTKDRVTTGIQKRLPWLTNLGMAVPRPEHRIWVGHPERNLGRGAFFDGT